MPLLVGVVFGVLFVLLAGSLLAWRPDTRRHGGVESSHGNEGQEDQGEA